MKKPRISVIIPVYNVEKHLKECLDSVINQTLKDIEIICINNGSTDSSPEILREYKRKEPRLLLIEDENNGSGFARGKGLKISQGEYIVFLDSDDYLATEDILETAWRKSRTNTPDLILCPILIKEKNITTLHRLIPDTFEKGVFTYKDFKQLVFQTFLAPWYKIYSKKFMGRFQDWYFPKYLYHQDVLFHIQIITRATSIEALNQPLTVYRADNYSVTRQKLTDKHINDTYTFITEVASFLKKEGKMEEFSIDFTTFVIQQTYYRMLHTFFDIEVIKKFQSLFQEIEDVLKKNINLCEIGDYPRLSKSEFFAGKAMLRMSTEDAYSYLLKTAFNKSEKTISLQGRELSKCYKALENCNQEIANLNSDIANYQQEINNLNDSITNYQQEINNLNDSITNYQQEINNITSSITFKFAKKLASIASLILRGKK